jgi:hypothetical protein
LAAALREAALRPPDLDPDLPPAPLSAMIRSLL